MIRRILAWRPRWWRDAVAVIDGAPMPSDDYYPEPDEVERPKRGATVREWDEYFDELNRRKETQS